MYSRLMRRRGSFLALIMIYAALFFSLVPALLDGFFAQDILISLSLTLSGALLTAAIVWLTLQWSLDRIELLINQQKSFSSLGIDEIKPISKSEQYSVVEDVATTQEVDIHLNTLNCDRTTLELVQRIIETKPRFPQKVRILSAGFTYEEIQDNQRVPDISIETKILLDLLRSRQLKETPIEVRWSVASIFNTVIMTEKFVLIISNFVPSRSDNALLIRIKAYSQIAEEHREHFSQSWREAGESLKQLSE